MHKIFVSDYDGAIIDKDFYSLLAARYVPADTPDAFAQYREGRISHFDAMAAYFAFAPTEEQPPEELPSARTWASLERFCGAPAGNFGWFSLAPPGTSSEFSGGAGVAATVYSNPGRLENGRGLVLEKLDSSSPYHSASVGGNSSAVVRLALRVADAVARAGDGLPDLQPALLVRPGLRFARGFLAEALRELGETFRPFSRWSEIARELA